MQEASALRKEQARRATEQKMLEQVLQAQKEKAERDRETNKASSSSCKNTIRRCRQATLSGTPGWRKRKVACCSKYNLFTY
jgi:hypothetical protein